MDISYTTRRHIDASLMEREESAFRAIRQNPDRFGFKSEPEFGTSLWMTMHYQELQEVNHMGHYRNVELLPIEYEAGYWICKCCILFPSKPPSHSTFLF